MNGNILFEKIMARIEREKELLGIKRRIFIFSCGFICSLIGLVSSFLVLKTQAASSGLWQIFSLIFSDFWIITGIWQNFAISVLERIPTVSIIIFSGIILILLQFIKLLLRDIKIIVFPKRILINNQKI